MPEALKGLLEALKSSGYEFLAVFLPGILAAGTIDHVFAVPKIPTLGWIVIAYAVGLGVQGVGASVFKKIDAAKKRLVAWRAKRKKRELPKAPLSAADEAHQFIIPRLQTKLGDDLPESIVFDVCLTRVDAKRQVYDKFMALADTARGLTIIFPPIVAMLAAYHAKAISEGGIVLAVAKWTAVVLIALVGVRAFAERYRRYSPLARQAVLGQYIASLLDPAPTSTGTPPTSDEGKR